MRNQAKEIPKWWCLLFWIRVPLKFSVLVPQMYVGFLWANMPLYFIGLQIKRKSTWETTSGKPNLHLDWFRGRGWKLSWCHNGLRLWRSWGRCTVFCLWEWCELLRPDYVTLYYPVIVIVIFVFPPAFIQCDLAILHQEIWWIWVGWWLL